MYVKHIFCFPLIHWHIGILYEVHPYLLCTSDGQTFAEEEAVGPRDSNPETRVLMTIVAPPLEMMTPKNDRREPGRCIAVMRYWGRREKVEWGLRHPIKIVPGRSRMLGWKLGRL